MRAGDHTNWEPETTQMIRLALARHQLRREQGVPTLGVLIGAAAEAEAVWREWAQAAGWRAVVREAAEATEEDAPDAAVLHLRQASEDGLAETVARLCRWLDAADPGQRRRPLALAVSREEAARFLRAAPFDRARTFFTEGSVALAAGDESNLTGEPPGGAGEGGASLSLTRSAPSLARQPLQPATVAGFDAVSAAFHRMEAGLANPDETDRARSAAERFLADLLAELPETRGLFELNVRLNFCFGPKRMEVDLFAAGLRLAVEIDGYYHFRDPEGYRRDRRKDALLQRQGYLVLRFLAEDVVVRLEEILEEIRGAVAFRRATLG